MSDNAAALAMPRPPRIPARVVRGATLGAGRLTGVAAQMGVQIAVGTLTGPAGIGTLQVHVAWSTLLGEVIGAGEPTRAMRDTAVNGPHTVRASLRRASRRILGFATLPALAAAALYASGQALELGIAMTMLLSIVVAAPLFALGRLFAETLKALGRTLTAVTLENTVLPATLLLTCAAAALGLLTLNQGAILASAVTGVLLCAMLLCWSLTTLRRADDTGGTATTRSTGGTEQLHFWLTGLLNIAFLQLPFLLLPWLADADDVGRYAVAHKLVNIITTLLILIAAVYGPRFARSAGTGDVRLAQRELRETQQLSLALFVPAWAAMVLFTDFWETLFSTGAGTLGTLLLVLGLGQLVNAATGLSGVLLTMSGAAHLEMRLLVATLILVTATAIPLGLTWGAIGVAAAASGGMALRNLAGYLLARQHLHRIKEQPA